MPNGILCEMWHQVPPSVRTGIDLEYQYGYMDKIIRLQIYVGSMAGICRPERRQATSGRAARGSVKRVS